MEVGKLLNLHQVWKNLITRLGFMELFAKGKYRFIPCRQSHNKLRNLTQSDWNLLLVSKNTITLGL
jgi:hypothetical protein